MTSPPGDYPPGGYPDPYQPPPGPGYPPPPPRGTNGFAIAGFILSLLCVAPLGLIFGIIGLVQTKGGKQRGLGLAIAAIVLSVITGVAGTVAFLALVVFVEVAKELVPSNDLRAGDCISTIPKGDIGDLLRVSCGDEHEGEVVTVFTPDQSDFPDDAVRQRYDASCEAAIAQYTASSPSELNAKGISTLVIYPSKQAWDNNQRSFVCIARTPADHTGSVKGGD